MGHAQNDFFHAEFRALLDYGIHCGDERFGAFAGETLLANVFGVEEFFE